MAKTPPKLKKYEEQKDSPFVANARKLMERGYGGLNENVDRVNTMNDGTMADINSRLGNIYNRAKSDFDISYRDTIAKQLASEYGKFGNIGSTPSLYRGDMTNRTAQRELADLAYNKSKDYEGSVNNELSRRYNTMDMYNKLYSYGAIPQEYDDKNYELSKINQDRMYQNDMTDWANKQRQNATLTNLGADAVGWGLAPLTGGASIAVANALKAPATNLIAPYAQNYSTGVTREDTGNLLGATKYGRRIIAENDSLKKQFTGTNGGDNSNDQLMELLRKLFGMGGTSWRTGGAGGYTGNWGGMA